MAQGRGEEPPEGLDALVARHGGYTLIPADVWQSYDLAQLEYRASMHERHRIAISTVAVGVHLVSHGDDYRRFARWLSGHRHPLLVSRAIWRRLKYPQNRARLEHWMRLWKQEHPDHLGNK